MEVDERDRKREKEELEEIRQRLLDEGHPNPDAELRRVRLSTLLSVCMCECASLPCTSAMSRIVVCCLGEGHFISLHLKAILL